MDAFLNIHLPSEKPRSLYIFALLIKIHDPTYLGWIEGRLLTLRDASQMNDAAHGGSLFQEDQIKHEFRAFGFEQPMGIRHCPSPLKIRVHLDFFDLGALKDALKVPDLPNQQ